MTTYKYPNVILDTEEAYRGMTTKPDGTKLDIEVNPFMAALIDVIAVKYPMWEFQLYDARKVDFNTMHANYFKVFNGANPREHIGNISLGKKYRSDGEDSNVYIIGGKRVAAKRERGTAVETKHVKVAIKAIDKYFTPAPWDERLDAVYDEGAHIIHMAESDAGRQLRHLDQKLDKAVHKFVTDNWSSFLSMLNPKEHEVAESRVESNRVHQELSKLHHEALNKRNMLTLIIEGDKYVVHSINGVSTYSSEQLPEEVRMKIGMLKLAELRDVITGIGTRTNAGYLIVLDQPIGA